MAYYMFVILFAIVFCYSTTSSLSFLEITSYSSSTKGL